ncbi:uncharacterized protein LOC126824481, partial [Patella vulgata]|uniref:uncharacterized protein LOC126824481 n=1 Tax=Patella vulgata TaxID=6465 RepID=UPI002180430B
ISSKTFDNENTNYLSICKLFPEKIFLLIAVPSRTSEFEERKVIRQAWGSNYVSGPAYVLSGDITSKLHIFDYHSQYCQLFI